MADDKARIEAELVGANQVAGEARKMEGALVGAGKNIESKLGGALSSVTGGLANVVKGGLAAAGVLEGINIARAVDQVKQLDSLTMRLGQTSGYVGSSIEAHFGKLEKKILTSSLAQADFARGLGRLTYDSKGAVDGVGALGTVALATGQTLEEQAGFGKALKSMQTPIADAVGEMDKLRGVADQLGLQGGVQALKDDLSKLEPVLQGVNLKTEEAKNRLRGLAGILAQGQTPERGAQLQAGALTMLRSRALDIERATGRKVLDDYGNLIDPAANLQDLHRLNRSRHGSDAERRAAAMATYGTDLGLAIYRGGFDQAERIGSLSATGKTEKDAAAALNTPEGQREARRLGLDAARRDAARPLVDAGDSIAEKLGPWGIMALSALSGTGGNLLGGAVKGLLGAGGASTAAGAEGASLLAGGSLLGPLAFLGGGVLAQGAVLSDIGQDRDEMGKEWQQSHAKTIGAELARRAQEQGGFSEDLMGRAGGDRGALVEMLKVLDSRKDQLSPSFAQDVATALAAELRRAPLQVRQDRDPNQSPGGN